jgi:hypothetical protein
LNQVKSRALSLTQTFENFVIFSFQATIIIPPNLIHFLPAAVHAALISLIRCFDRATEEAVVVIESSVIPCRATFRVSTLAM